MKFNLLDLTPIKNRSKKCIKYLVVKIFKTKLLLYLQRSVKIKIGEVKEGGG